MSWALPEGSGGIFLEFGIFQKKGGGGMNIGGLAMQAFGGAVNYGFSNQIIAVADKKVENHFKGNLTEKVKKMFVQSSAKIVLFLAYLCQHQRLY